VLPLFSLVLIFTYSHLLPGGKKKKKKYDEMEGREEISYFFVWLIRRFENYEAVLGE
jgi:hypothetical protein